MCHSVLVMGALEIVTRPLARDYCSICDRRRRFKSFGDPPRLRAQCRQCGSLERHRALWAWLKPQLRPALRILHSAPEPSVYGELRRRSNLQYVTTELEPDAHARDRDMVQADLQRLPFGDGSFDVVVCSHVLEHVPDDRMAMREIRRVLTPVGLAAIQVPIHDRDDTYEDPTITTPEGRYGAFGQADHVRIYGRDFDDRLAAAGFDVTVVAAGHPGNEIHVARPSP
jgi:SAM-dependent methyltransferase